MNIIARCASLGVAGLLSCTAFAADTVTDTSPNSGVYGIMLAQTDGMERRDERRDDRGDNRDGRQDCRQEEGVVGGDKRDCKQDNRGSDEDAATEVEAE